MPETSRKNGVGAGLRLGTLVGLRLGISVARRWPRRCAAIRRGRILGRCRRRLQDRVLVVAALVGTLQTSGVISATGFRGTNTASFVERFHCGYCTLSNHIAPHFHLPFAARSFRSLVPMVLTLSDSGFIRPSPGAEHNNIAFVTMRSHSYARFAGHQRHSPTIPRRAIVSSNEHESSLIARCASIPSVRTREVSVLRTTPGAKPRANPKPAGGRRWSVPGVGPRTASCGAMMPGPPRVPNTFWASECAYGLPALDIAQHWSPRASR